MRVPFLLAIAVLTSAAATAHAAEQVLTPRYELHVPDGVERVDTSASHDALVASLKQDIAYIVHNAAELRSFPLSPEQVLPQVQVQTPITQLTIDDVEVLAFTVKIPVPAFLRDILLATFFSTDVGVGTDRGYHLRLHKEKGNGDSDVGIVLVRSATKEGLTLPEVEQIIRSFSTYE